MDMDKWKIIFALSFMKEGPAGLWKEAKMAGYKDKKPYGSWTDFKAELKKTFEPADVKEDVLTKLCLLWQTDTADDYIAKLQVL